MEDAFYGEVKILPYTFAPRGWVACNGQLLPIMDNQALFSIMGCLYGGDCRSVFAVPDLVGRTPMGEGMGPGLTPRPLAQMGGTAQVCLSELEIPSHQHEIINVYYDSAESINPNMHYLGRMNGNLFYKKAEEVSQMVQMNSATLSATGLSQAHENRQPYLAMQFCLCVDGVYPTRN